MRVPMKGDQPSIMFIHLSEILAGDRNPRQEQRGEIRPTRGQQARPS